MGGSRAAPSPLGEKRTTVEIELQAARADSLPPRSGGEGGEVRSTEPGGGSRRSDCKQPPTPNPSPPLASLAGGGEPRGLIHAWPGALDHTFFLVKYNRPANTTRKIITCSPSRLRATRCGSAAHARNAVTSWA